MDTQGILVPGSVAPPDIPERARAVHQDIQVPARVVPQDSRVLRAWPQHQDTRAIPAILVLGSVVPQAIPVKVRAEPPVTAAQVDQVPRATVVPRVNPVPQATRVLVNQEPADTLAPVSREQVVTRVSRGHRGLLARVDSRVNPARLDTQVRVSRVPLVTLVRAVQEHPDTRGWAASPAHPVTQVNPARVVTVVSPAPPAIRV